jgi:hypothetical protein
MLRALIWKDVLTNRFPLLLAAALVVASYAVTAVLMGLDPSLTYRPWGWLVAETLVVGSLASHAAAQLSLAVLAGNLIAVERVNRSAEFLAYLPASRVRVLQAKATVLAVTALTLLLVPLSIGGLTAWLSGLPLLSGGPRYILFLVVSISAVGFCASGIGWLGSCVLQSNAVAILFALVVPWVLAMVVTTAARGTAPGATLLATNLSVGLAGFLFGTRHYLARVEP